MEFLNNKVFNEGLTMLHQEILKFTLALYNDPYISRNAIDSIIHFMNNFISNSFIPHLVRQFEISLKSTTDETFYKTKYILEKNKDIFQKFNSEKQRFDIYAQEGLFVQPDMIEIGKDYINTCNESSACVVKSKSVYAAYVPLKNSLKSFLQIPGVFKQIMQYMKDLAMEKSHISNIIQGELWKNKYNDSSKIIIPLFFYFDEFETRNPLGSHAGAQKLGGGYASIAVLPPHLASKLTNVFVVTVFHSKYLKKFGNEAIFSEAISQFNDLSSNGINITVNDKETQVFFECPLLLGDNLGLNTICGFNESFSADIFCRICTAKKILCQTMTIENSNLIRYSRQYDTAVSDNNLASIGMKTECMFNKIPKFHIHENFTVDLMHDLHEGVAVHTIGNILEALIKNKVVKLDTINRRIDTFNYGEIEKNNKPQPLYFNYEAGGEKLKLKLSAAESICLCRYLGLILGDLVPLDNEYWQLYIYIRKIIGILTSPILTRSQMKSTTDLVHQHNELYLKLFGALTPKMHFLTHYSRVMQLNGPVFHFSSMKFERENRQLKQMAIGISSNAQLPLTITIRSQLRSGYNMKYQQFPNQDYECGPEDNNNSSELLRRFIPNLAYNASIVTLKCVYIIGNSVSPGSVIVYQITDHNPIFAKIINIFKCDENVYFEILKLHSTFFNEHYQAYNVTCDIHESHEIISVENILRTSPCLLVKKKDKMYVASRFNL